MCLHVAGELGVCAGGTDTLLTHHPWAGLLLTDPSPAPRSTRWCGHHHEKVLITQFGLS